MPDLTYLCQLSQPRGFTPAADSDGRIHIAFPAFASTFVTGLYLADIDLTDEFQLVTEYDQAATAFEELLEDHIEKLRGYTPSALGGLCMVLRYDGGSDVVVEFHTRYGAPIRFCGQPTVSSEHFNNLDACFKELDEAVAEAHRMLAFQDEADADAQADYERERDEAADRHFASTARQ